MDLFGRSLLVFYKEWPGILGMLGIFGLGGGTIFFSMKAVFKDRLSQAEYFALGAGGALLPLLLGSGLVALINYWGRVNPGFIPVWMVLLVIAGQAAWRATGGQGSWKPPRWAGAALAVFLVCSVFIRLAFIWDLQVPSYFDSAMHYTVIEGLIKDFRSFALPDLQTFVGGYYHLGFHVLVGAISQALNLPVLSAILLFGQILTALLPLPVFFILRQETKLEAPALFAAALAGWGWYMPAHMLNWGKYPALTSILSFEFAVCCLILLRQARGYRWWFMLGLLGLGTLCSTFIHSRSLVLIGLLVLSGLATAGWERLPGLAQKLLAALGAAGLIALVYVVQSKPVLKLAFDPYLGNQAWMSLLILALLPFAFKAFPRATFTCLLFALMLVGSLLVSVTQFLPVYDAQTLLDRPFVEGFLFFPLAVLGGLGYAGMRAALKSSSYWPEARQRQISALMGVCLFGTLLVSLPQYNFYPSPCCKLFTEQDAAALEWLDKNSAPEASILIASFQTVVFESTQPADLSGADAGIWITPFIQRKAALAAYSTDFSAQGGLDEVCKMGVTYIYAGGTNQSFNKAQLDSKPEWYARQLTLPGIRIYRLVGCP